MSPIAFSILLLALVSIVTVVQGDCPAGKTYAAVNDVYAYVDACTFSTTNLNKSCVSASCPSLTTSKLCPTKNGTFDNSGVITQINECFSSMTTLCGTQWDPNPIPQFSVTGLSLAGIATFGCTSGGLTLAGLKQTTLASISLVPGSPNAYALSFSSPNVSLKGAITCTFTLTATSILGISAPAVKFTGGYTASYTSAATVNILTTAPSISGKSSQVTHKLNVVPPLGNLIPAEVLNPVLAFAQNAFLNAGDDAEFTSYGALFVAYALQVLQDNCKSP